MNARVLPRATSAFLCAALLAFIRSSPRSSFNTRSTLAISSALSRGLPQKVHGPRPCLTQMILPQFMQLGAMSRSGCRVAIQLHLRFSSSAAELAEEDNVGFVWTSKLRMAESRSDSVEDAPCMAVPPEILILVFGAGDGFLDDCAEAAFLGLSESDMSGPAAEGGAFAVIEFVVAAASSVISGICVASGGLSRSARFSATTSLCFCFEDVDK